MMMARRWLERASRDVVLRRNLPSDFDSRPIWVSPGAALSYWRRNLNKVDGRLLGWAAALIGEGNHVWDVGANVGLFTFSAAVRSGCSGSVVAIEPDPWMCTLLRRSAGVSENRAFREASVEVVEVAVGNADGISVLNIAARSRSASFLGPAPVGSETGGVREQIKVHTRTLDSLREGRQDPDLIKIDVEGFEANVLRGAARLLSEVRPRLIIEVLEPNVPELTRILKNSGYIIRDLERSGWPESAVATYSTLALPR
jgi:FkbM family methyltransferase